MKRKHKIIGQILRGFELPQELDPHRFFVQWLGGAECLIEQHRGILCFEPDRIRFQTEQGILSFTGKSLEMTRLSESSALVCGGIRSVILEEKS